MLVLLETPAGYGLFKVQKSKLTEMNHEELYKEFETPEKAQKAVSLHAFHKFNDTKDALAAASALIESKLDKGLKKFLKKSVISQEITDQLAVSDKALGAVIRKKLNIEVAYTPQTQEIVRGIRTQLSQLIEGLSEQDTRQMALSLSHTLNRFKLKFSPEKVDTMIIQAIGLLDDLDRELNNFAMRLKEWYGWHFPELAKILTDNVIYAKVAKKIGFRHNTKSTDLTDLLSEDIEKEVKEAAEISMGTEVTEEDLVNIHELADRVVELTDYRASLADYLRYRMTAIAPNLTYMVGELVGARLISHAGSLMSLAKHPSSTVQILGAEKALFRALKTKKQTPKYGLIYHASLVGQSAPKLKGKISRVLAAKLALCTRVDALGDQTEPTVAISNKQYVERKLESLSDEVSKGISKSMARPAPQKYMPMKSGAKGILGGTYSVAADSVKRMDDKKRSGGPGEFTKVKKVKKEEEDDE